MRKKFLSLLITPLLIGCQNLGKQDSAANGKGSFDYSDFDDIKLEWNELFSPAKSQYFAYIYSISCGHCERIKETVLNTVDSYKNLFYLIEYSDDIPVITNPFETIGKEKIEEVGILGTPTLIEVSNKFIALNIAGESEITDYLSLLPHTFCN